LKRKAIEGKLPVTFLNNVAPEVIASTLSKSTIFWHLTGINEMTAATQGKQIDPASLEHFGIAVVEAMSMGCIPIVLNLGGNVDIVDHGINGYLASSIEDYLKFPDPQKYLVGFIFGVYQTPQ
jgi:glycosyltransferase involved in cell wall biosynthesis